MNEVEIMIKSLSLPIETLKEITEYKEVLNNSYRMEFQYFDVVERFYRGCDITGVYRCMHHPCFNDCTRNFRIRFMIIDINEDYVYIPIKVTDDFMRRHTYVSIAQEPLSLCGNRDNVEIAKKILCEKSFVERDTIISDDESLKDIDTIFYNTPEDFKFMNTSTWRSKHGINKLNRLIEITDGSIYGSALEGIVLDINKVWNKYKLNFDKSLKGKKSMTTKEDTRLAQLSLKTNNLKCLVFSYNGSFIGYTFFADVLDCRGAMSLATKQVTNSFEYLKDWYGEDSLKDENLYAIHKNYSDFVQYFLNKMVLVDENREVFYNPGGTKTYNAGLYNFKSVFYKNVLTYRWKEIGGMGDGRF